MAKRERFIERDTPILPYVLASSVIEEVERAFPFLPADDADYRRVMEELTTALTARAHGCYQGERFRRKVQGRGNTGRDFLAMFMRHWLTALLQTHAPVTARKLPQTFALGQPLALR